ncbi:hypothetical protein FBU30_005450 [Linnemannia zychae]|nr:hypothetical protein FBU30_005450 [Linnemannia zychae]
MTRRILTISLSIFMVSAMAGYPIPIVDSVTIPSSTLSGSPSSSVAISMGFPAADTTSIGGNNPQTPTTSAAVVATTNIVSPSSSFLSDTSSDKYPADPKLVNAPRPDDPASTTPQFVNRVTVPSRMDYNQPGRIQKRDTVSQPQVLSPVFSPPSQQYHQQWQQWDPIQQQSNQGLHAFQEPPPSAQPYTFQRRATSVPIATTPVASLPPISGMSAIVCNHDTTSHGLLHCSDNNDYTLLDVSINPANTANLNKHSKREVTSQSVNSGRYSGSIVSPSGGYFIPSAYLSPINPVALGKSPYAQRGSESPDELHNSQSYAQFETLSRSPNQDQAQYQQQQTKIIKRAEPGTDWSNGDDLTTIMAGNKAGKDVSTSSISTSSAATNVRQHGGLSHSDAETLNKYSSGSGYGYGNWGDEWRAGNGGKSWSSRKGKKWNKRTDTNVDDRVDNTVVDTHNLGTYFDSGPVGKYYGHNWYKDNGSGYGAGKQWNKRQLLGGVGPSTAIGFGRSGIAFTGSHSAVPVPINIGLIWDGSNVNLVPSGSAAAPNESGGMSGIGPLASIVGGNEPAIPVPINIDALVYPDGQISITPSN